MRIAFRFAGLVALLAPLLGACAELPADSSLTPAPPASVPVAFRIEVSGAAPAILSGEEGEGVMVLRAKGAEAPVAVPFANGALVSAPLPPGRYEIEKLGILQCRGLGFEVAGGSAARALGTIRAEVVETRYYVALMASLPAAEEDVATLAAATGTDPAMIDAAPLVIREQAPCFISRAGPAMTWQELPLEEKILLGMGFAAFCALAVASGGFCVF